jgi:AraC-like DNA-binding protein
LYRLNVSSLELANARLPLADLWKGHARELAEQWFESANPEAAAIILERSLSERMPGYIRSDHTGHHLRRALRECSLTHERQVRELGRDLGLSKRSVRRRCHELFGYDPKTFARILRFQRLINSAQRADRIPIEALASLCGYADQAHLSREVRRLSGLTPAAVVAQFAAGA